MTYLGELRRNWRPLLAATIGMGSGMSLVGVITSTIAPSLVADVGWSKADFAMVGSLALIMSFVFPFIGRLTDLFGVRRTALIGQVVLPLVYLAYSLMDGRLGVYMVIFAVQSVICVTTTSTVYTRLPVQYVKNARGLALAIVASGPALAGIVIAPLLNDYVELHGWRAAYQAVAIFTAIAGLATFLLIPASSAPAKSGTAAPKRRAREDYPAIFRMPAFWILLGAMLLCNLPQTIILVQLKLLLLANGVTGEGAGIMLSTVSVGMLAGRFVTGVALDRFPPYFVSFVSLALPSLGLFIIASSFDAPAVLTAAVFCLGFAFGAEGDIVAFLVARHFGVEIYSSTLGLLTAAMSFSTAAGAALLSYTLARTGGYETFLVIVGCAVLAGAAMILLLGRAAPARVPVAEGLAPRAS
ncbi:putative MFS family arabinose efflux permease [Novosphingobium sp. PhB165]|uniref:MFS transporter n=1 Tax=Novosphingobium sp. PhB165 TaxID=2485105 RepID=UPI00104868C6|nr:MFS transporter [Novosphingobium sp. PhB165]TCM20493.1 putative MFS family arabinose efflux permease [Novosphingobium sp. PhB165]